MNNTRKTIFLLFVITALLAVVILVWYFFVRQQSNNPNINNPTNPFGQTAPSLRGSEFIQNNSNDNSSSFTEVTPGQEPLLTKIWDKPTAGFAFVEKAILINSTSTKMIKGTSTEIVTQKKATSTRMFFTDRTTGYVYGYNLENKKVYQITNTTLPGIYDSYFFDNGNYVIMRYLDDNENIVSVLEKIPSVSENGTPLSFEKTTYLPNNVTSVSISSSGKSASYLVSEDSGSSMRTIKNGKDSLAYSSTLSELKIVYAGEIPYVYTKPSASIQGYAINTQTGERLLGDKTGLTALPANNNDDFLYTTWINSDLTTSIFSKKINSVRTLYIKTLADKCVWGKSSFFAFCGVPQTIERNSLLGLPDAWYQGFVQFSDSVYLLDNKLSIEKPVFNFSKETKELIDLIKPGINSNDSRLGFINKQNGSLWMLNIKDLVK